MKITPIDKAYGTVFNLIKDKYLSQVNVRKGGYDPRMKHPLYMIDGRRAEESEVKALSLDWVERIDVIENSAAMLSLQTIVEFESKDSKGMTVMNYDYADGAISIILKDGAYNKSAYHSATLKFSGYNEPRIFYSPKHHTTLESDYKPDLRTTLFWEPNIKVKNNKELLLNYYNADNSSVIRVTVEGITSDGIPVTSTSEYEVQ